MNQSNDADFPTYVINFGDGTSNQDLECMGDVCFSYTQQVTDDYGSCHNYTQNGEYTISLIRLRPDVCKFMKRGDFTTPTAYDKICQVPQEQKVAEILIEVK